MAYLNCPYCPSQSFLVRNAEHSDRPPLEKYRCPAQHVFYVEEEHNGDTEGKPSD